MPESHSFPSGHTASAFAFSSALGAEMPSLATPLRLMATTVAYSRVHTGVHYPGDVVIGALIGAGLGTGTRLVARRRRRQWEMTIFSTTIRMPSAPARAVTPNSRPPDSPASTARGVAVEQQQQHGGGQRRIARGRDGQAQQRLPRPAPPGARRTPSPCARTRRRGNAARPRGEVALRARAPPAPRRTARPSSRRPGCRTPAAPTRPPRPGPLLSPAPLRSRSSRRCRPRAPWLGSVTRPGAPEPDAASTMSPPSRSIARAASGDGPPGIVARPPPSGQRPPQLVCTDP